MYYNYIAQIVDGGPRSDNVTTWCGGGAIIPPVTSTGNELFVTFKSDDSVVKSGFLAVYTGECCSLALTNIQKNIVIAVSLQ